MIRFLTVSLVAAGIAAAQTTPAPASPVNGQRPRPARSPGRGPGGPGPDVFGPNGEARLTKRLALDAGQQNTLHTAILSATVQQQGLKDKITAARTRLATAMKAGDENGIDQATQEIAGVNQQQQAIHAKTLAKVYTSLREDQRTKFETELNRAAGVPGLGPQGPRPQNGPGGRGPRPRRTPPQAAVPAQQ